MDEKDDQISHSASISSKEEKNIQATDVQPIISFTKDLIGDSNVITTVMSPHGEEIPVTGDVDDAMKLALEAEELQLTPEEDRKLVRKIDLCMFPLMCLLYAVQFMDKTTNGNAAVMGLVTSLHMHGEQYSWVGSAFYFGYLGGLFVLPPLMQKAKYFMKTVSAIIILWGMVLALHSAPTVNYASFIFLRCLLGFLESAITPAFTIITSQYWKKEEQFLRICIWFSFNGFGGIWGSSMAYGLYIRQNTYSIEAWKIVFIITGCITIFVGFLMAIHLPDSPEKAWFLTHREKLLLVQRIRGNQQGFGNHHIKKKQIIEALIDPRTWLYFLYSFAADIPNGGMTNFMSILFKEDFQFDTKQTLLVDMGPAAVEWVSLPFFGLLSYYCYTRKFKILESRILWSTFTTAIVFIGTCMLAFADDNKQARLAGICLMYIAPIAFICTLACVSANTLGYTKKWTVSSINLLGYCAGNIVGPQTFKEAPYTGAKIAMVVCYGACIFILLALYALNVRENRRRDKAAMENKQPLIENIEFADLTDFENPYFRYTL
ncbi:probable Allantoate permease [Zygosaccharomyces bailii ISA1307]|nr:probable Allantoate permease [Zygosaccharomyces bailii ISA1307]